jgi:hypothetical protein
MSPSLLSICLSLRLSCGAHNLLLCAVGLPRAVSFNRVFDGRSAMHDPLSLLRDRSLVAGTVQERTTQASPT